MRAEKTNSIYKVRISSKDNWKSNIELTKLAPGLILEGSRPNLVGKIFDANELDVLACHILLTDTGLEEQITKHHTLPNVGGNSRGTPVESDGLTDHVLLLASIAGTYQSDGKLTRFHGGQLVHANLKGLRNETGRTTDADLVLVPGQLRTSAVVANVMQARGCDETELIVNGQRRLNVERMTTSQTDQTAVTRNPLVGSALVAIVGSGLQVEHVLGILDNLGGRSVLVLGQKWDGNGAGVGTLLSHRYEFE